MKLQLCTYNADCLPKCCEETKRCGSIWIFEVAPTGDTVVCCINRLSLHTWYRRNSIFIVSMAEERFIFNNGWCNRTWYSIPVGSCRRVPALPNNYWMLSWFHSQISSKVCLRWTFFVGNDTTSYWCTVIRGAGCKKHHYQCSCNKREHNLSRTAHNQLEQDTLQLKSYSYI